MQQFWRFAIAVLCLVPLVATARSSVWTVEHADGVALYLVGSVHVLRESDYPLPAEFETAYTGAGRLVFETDLDALEEGRMQALVLSRGLYPEGDGLGNHLDETTYRRLMAFCRERSLPLAQFERMRPWLLVLSLSAMEMESLGFGRETGLDAHFHARAVADGKEIEGLEPPDEHLALLAALDQELGEALVGDFLEDMRRLRGMLDDLVAAWRQGDEGALDALVSRDMAERSPALHRRLVLERNRRWLPRIRELIDAGEPAMVVVGSAHLVGEGSVVDLLRRAGYRLKQLDRR